MECQIIFSSAFYEARFKYNILKYLENVLSILQV